MEFKIPFSKDMAAAVIDGKKTCTTRSKRYGAMGDTFIVVGLFMWCECQITNLAHMTLENVAKAFCRQEGFDSPEAFIERWKRLHPVAGFVPNQLVWLMEFKIIGENGRRLKGV